MLFCHLIFEIVGSKSEYYYLFIYVAEGGTACLDVHCKSGCDS